VASGEVSRRSDCRRRDEPDKIYCPLGIGEFDEGRWFTNLSDQRLFGETEVTWHATAFALRAMKLGVIAVCIGGNSRDDV
jgi:uncharacterized protein (DUF849 family)